MLAIRMQRTGRKGHAMFRVVVQDSRVTPTSGRVVAQLGHYDPHTKTIVVDKEKASLYLSNGAQPSERVARLLKSEGVKLPDWVITPESKTRTIRNAEKLRKNQPKEEKVEVPEAVEESVTPVDEPTETPAEDTADVETEENAEPAEESEDTPAEETATDDATAEDAVTEVADDKKDEEKA